MYLCNNFSTYRCATLFCDLTQSVAKNAEKNSDALVKRHPTMKRHLSKVNKKNQGYPSGFPNVKYQRSDHAGRHICKACGITFTWEAALCRHIKSRRYNAMLYHCEHCKKKFSSCESLQCHLIHVHGRLVPVKEEDNGFIPNEDADVYEEGSEFFCPVLGCWKQFSCSCAGLSSITIKLTIR